MPRENDRVSLLCEVELESAAGKRGARISDVSPGGCYIDSIIGVGEGEDLAFVVDRHDGGRMRFTAKVAYVLEGVGFGVTFTDLTDEQNAFIAELMKQ